LPRASRAITRNDAVPRTASCSLAGITSSETTRAGAGDPTTTVMMALRPSLAAVTSTVPARPPVRTPVDETATTAGSLLDHSMRRPAGLPRPSIDTSARGEALGSRRASQLHCADRNGTLRRLREDAYVVAPFGELCERLACGIVEPDAVNAHSGHRRFEGRPALPRILFEHAHDAIGQGRRGFRPPLAQGARRVEEVLL